MSNIRKYAFETEFTPEGEIMREPPKRITPEEVLALRPDLVVADPFLAPATRAALAKSGVEVVSMPIARSIAESRAQVLAN